MTEPTEPSNYPLPNRLASPEVTLPSAVISSYASTDPVSHSGHPHSTHQHARPAGQSLPAPSDGQSAPPAPLSFRGHIAGLDALRGIAILGVMLFHAYPMSATVPDWHGPARVWFALMEMGHTGVYLFFILSGFLITGILLDEKQSLASMPATERSQLAPAVAGGFYARRMRRILPAYLLLVALICVTHATRRSLALLALILAADLSRSMNQLYGVWSLAVEEQFYLLWPWIVWYARPRTIRCLIILCLVASPLIRLAAGLSGQDVYFKPWDNVDYLMYGALFACLVRTGELHSGNITMLLRRLALGGAAGLALLTALSIPWGTRPAFLLFFAAAGRLSFVALFLAMLLASIAAHQNSAKPLASRTLFVRPRRLALTAFSFTGYISYGLYLYHPMVFGWYDRLAAHTALAGTQHSFLLLTIRAVTGSGATFLLAWLSRITLEAWFLRRKKKPKLASIPV